MTTITAVSDADTQTSPGYRSFLSEHGPDFTEPALIRRAFAGPKRLSTLLLDAIGTITTASDGSVRLRAFDGFAMNYHLINTLASAAPTGGDAPNWLHTHGGSTACVAVNQLSRWSVPLAAWYIDRIHELTTLGGHLGTETLDTYTFISAGEGWTPFGIHNDYEPSFIYHLGPGPKTAWIWPAGEPTGAMLSASPALNGVSFGLSDLSSARGYVMQPGDFLCIPPGLYHVFENTHPSAFLGITIFPNSIERVFEELLGEGDHAAVDRPSPAAITDVRDTIDAITGRLQGQLPDMGARFDRRMRRLRSAGLVHPPHRAALAALPKPDPQQNFSTSFPGVFAPGGSGDHVFVNGRTVRNIPTHDTTTLCGVLNTLQDAGTAEVSERCDIPIGQVGDMLTRFTLLGGLQQ